MRRTTITAPDGSQTVIVSESRGRLSGCVTAMALVTLLVAPLAMPLPLTVICYAVEALLLLGWLMARRGRS